MKTNKKQKHTACFLNDAPCSRGAPGPSKVGPQKDQLTKTQQRKLRKSPKSVLALALEVCP